MASQSGWVPPRVVLPILSQSYTAERVRSDHRLIFVQAPFRPPLPGEPLPEKPPTQTFPPVFACLDGFTSPSDGSNRIQLNVAAEFVPSIITIEEYRNGPAWHREHGAEQVFTTEMMIEQEGPVLIDVWFQGAEQTPVTLRVGRYQVVVEVANRSEAIRLEEAHFAIDLDDEDPNAPDFDPPPTEHWWIKFSRVKGVV